MPSDQFAEDIDALDGVTPPWLCSKLYGHDDVFEAVQNRFHAKRGHHALLLKGRQGIGKASFAYHSANAMMDQALAGRIRLSHPNLFVLKRRLSQDRKRFNASISIDQVRDLIEKLHQTPTLDCARVVIVDAIDDMRIEAANTLLKTLEEPPNGVQFLLVCHRPTQILPTILSRCQAVPLQPLSMEAADLAVRASLNGEPAFQEVEIGNAVAACRGAPGGAAQILACGLLPLYEITDVILNTALKGRVDITSVQELVSSTQSFGRDVALEVIGGRIWHGLADTCKAQALSGHIAIADHLSEVANVISADFRSAEVLNLDLLGTIVSSLQKIADATRSKIR